MPTSDPQFSLKRDLLSEAYATELIYDLSSSEEMKQYFAGETVPGDNLASDAAIDLWIHYIKNNFRPNYHAVGICSMMSQQMGCVVDAAAKICGIHGLCVIHGSFLST